MNHQSGDKFAWENNLKTNNEVILHKPVQRQVKTGDDKEHVTDEEIHDYIIGSLPTPTHLSRYDVLLCQRQETKYYNHYGNVRYRALVKQHMPTYLKAINSEQKSNIARNIINIIHNSNPSGRFLEKKSNEEWYEVEESTILLDISQTMLQTAFENLKNSIQPIKENENLVSHSNELMQVPITDIEPYSGPHHEDEDDILSMSSVSELSDFSAYEDMLSVLLPGQPQSQDIQVTKKDVLCGRGDKTNQHEGNIRYRSLIKHYKIAYLATNKSKQKRLISEIIMDTVYTSGGRFLKKDASTGKWNEVNRSVAFEKTCQALRQRCHRMRKFRLKEAKCCVTSL